MSSAGPAQHTDTVCVCTRVSGIVPFGGNKTHNTCPGVHFCFVECRKVHGRSTMNRLTLETATVCVGLLRANSKVNGWQRVAVEINERGSGFPGFVSSVSLVCALVTSLKRAHISARATSSVTVD